MAKVELAGVYKRFGALEVCSNVNLVVADKEFVTLLGSSGCGKTTILNMIAGLEDVSAGEIRMEGRVVNNLTPFERDVAMVFQNYALYPHMTVAENIGFTLRLRRISRAEIEKRVGTIAGLLELTPLLGRLPSQLSGGQQQRVAIGRAMVREPKTFLFDEPFSNLDAALRVRMRSEIKLLHQRLGVTSIFVTHDQEEALSISDRVAVINEGRVEQVGTPEEIYVRPVSRYVARFIGSPQIDLLDGAIVEESGGVGFRVGHVLFSLPQPLVHVLRAQGALELGVRPENVLIADRGTAANVRVVNPVGPASFVTLAWEGGLITARVPGMSRLKAGEAVQFTVDPQHLMFFDKASGRRIEVPAEL
jgi:ABC-type sugar transport system ATPase subunit